MTSAQSVLHFEGKSSTYTVNLDLTSNPAQDIEFLDIKVENTQTKSKSTQHIDKNFLASRQQFSCFPDPSVIYDYLSQKFNTAVISEKSINFTYTWGELKKRQRQISIELVTTAIVISASVITDQSSSLAKRVKELESDLQTSKKECQATKNDLEKTKTDFQASKKECQATKADLQKTKADFQASKNECQKVKNQLKNNQDAVQKNGKELQLVKDDLTKTKDDLQSSMASCHKVKDELQSVKNELKTTKDEMKAIKENLTKPGGISSGCCNTNELEKKYDKKIEQLISQLQLVQSRLAQLEKGFGKPALYHHPGNFHLIYYQLTQSSIVAAKLLRQGRTDVWYNFVNGSEIRPNQVVRYKATFSRVTNGAVIIGFCTSQHFGAIDCWQFKDTAYYYCAGEIFQGGVKQHVNEAITYEDVVDFQADLSAQKLRWWKNQKTLIKEIDVPQAMVGKTIFASVMMLNSGDSIDLAKV